VYTAVDNGCGTRIFEGELVGTATYVCYANNKCGQENLFLKNCLQKVTLDIC